MVTAEGLRPDLPSDIAGLPGGSFEGMPLYLQLMQVGVAQNPSGSWFGSQYQT